MGEYMKKTIMMVFLLLCGCSNKLTCTYKEDYEDIKINNKIVFNFKNNTYNEIDVMTFNDEESALKYFNEIEDYIEEYNLSLEGNKIISELSDSIKLDATKKEIKNQYEAYDYTCK